MTSGSPRAPPPAPPSPVSLSSPAHACAPAPAGARCLRTLVRRWGGAEAAGGAGAEPAGWGTSRSILAERTTPPGTAPAHRARGMRCLLAWEARRLLYIGAVPGAPTPTALPFPAPLAPRHP